MLAVLTEQISVASILLIVGEFLALVTIANIVMSSRSATSAWGWGMAVVAIPFVAVPLYWVFGRMEFKGYVERRREVLHHKEDLLDTLISTLEPHYATLTETQEWYGGALDKLSERRFTSGNDIRILDEGEETFEEIFRIIESAREYLLVQFYIVRSDDLGDRLRKALVGKAREGVQVYLLYDEIGSYGLSTKYINSLRRERIEVRPFHSTQGRSNRFQINFRNHRKMVLADGQVAVTGGHNVGNEYLGFTEKYGNWRDTSVRISGPAAMSLQMVFLEDWFWAAREIPELNWTQPDKGKDERGMTVMVLPFGPVEDVEGGTLFFLNAITRAKERLWIASPYFVPDACIVAALQLAALRGVDVRVMMPGIPDKKIPYLASFSFLKEMEAAGVKMMRFGDGFLHQKALLVDREMASIGTANLDNRSMRLNFEVNVVVMDGEFCDDVQAMFERDWEFCKVESYAQYRLRPIWFRLGVKLSRLAAPLL